MTEYSDPTDRMTNGKWRKPATTTPVDCRPPMTRKDYADYRSYHGMTPATMHYSEPKPKMQADPLWNAIWNEIKSWDINVPYEYAGYCGATGNHVTAIYLAIKMSQGIFEE